jgi:cell division GTPase FtsZ
VAVVTKPFEYEGKRKRLAEEGVNELAKHVDSLIVILNEKLEEVLGEEISMLEAFRPPTTCCATPWAASPRSSTCRAWSTSTSRTCAP